ncbi:MAG TPA: dihydroorotate dehydrogenase electron transfer subunit [Steroidobacteraceae bacterium]|jgi:dihydroorotate dehydrogenase electron transfer subunit|nr:dihydroorotate dehydrogenase electron transfer subunit [Steroidobacteraceae bacterium]
MTARESRGTLHLEDARVIRQTAYDGDQFVLRLAAAACAARAQPGSFVHLTCDSAIPMRRPLSIMRADPAQGWIEVLYKVLGPGLHALAARKPGDTLSLIGPIGKPFTVHPERPRPLLIGGGVGIPPMVFIADRLRDALASSGTATGGSASRSGGYKPLVLMGSEIPFPFRTRPSTIVVAGIPTGSIACMPLLDEWGIASRLASRAGLPGCYEGFVTELADEWLKTLAPAQLAEVEIFACGPTPMLAASAAVARRHGVPCQASLEEFMACAVGGCAGCTVLVRTPEGPAMKRVCVDGPVFDALTVF